MNTYLQGKNKIVAIVGKSGSGKTTICRQLRKTGLKELVSYTTRKRRFPNESSHYFVGKGLFKHVMEEEGCVAFTNFHGNWYGATRGQFIANDIYVIDPHGVMTLSNEVGRENIKVFYIDTKWYIRLYRMWKERGIKSAIQRLIHDKKAFKDLDYDHRVENNKFTDISRISSNIVKWIKVWE